MAFQSIKNNNLGNSCMDDIWKNISTVTVIIPSVHARAETDIRIIRISG